MLNEKTPDPITFHRQRSITGRRIPGVIAELGPVRGPVAKTKAMARAALLGTVAATLQNLEEGPVLLHFAHRGREVLFLVRPFVQGWGYTIIDLPLKTPAGGIADVSTRGGTLLGESRRDRRAAIKAATNHAAQYLWEPGDEVPEFFTEERVGKDAVSDFRRLMTWQNAYKAARDEGKTDAEARQIAGMS